MGRGFLLLPSVLLAACVSAGTTSPPSAGSPTRAPIASASDLPSAGASSTIPGRTAAPIATSTTSAGPRASAGAPSGATAPPRLVMGWPTVSRSGVSMTGRYPDTQPAWEGWPAPGPEVTLVVMFTGLTPGESVSLVGTGSYDFAVLGCGVEPSPCAAGSDTTDPSVQGCRPAYSQAVEGAVRTAAQAAARADGTAAVVLELVIPESQRACPAGASLPWYVQTGEWNLRVTDKAHGLRLVGPDVGIGP